MQLGALAGVMEILRTVPTALDTSAHIRSANSSEKNIVKYWYLNFTDFFNQADVHTRVFREGRVEGKTR